MSRKSIKSGSLQGDIFNQPLLRSKKTHFSCFLKSVDIQFVMKERIVQTSQINGFLLINESFVTSKCIVCEVQTYHLLRINISFMKVKKPFGEMKQYFQRLITHY